MRTPTIAAGIAAFVAVWPQATIANELGSPASTDRSVAISQMSRAGSYLTPVNHDTIKMAATVHESVIRRFFTLINEHRLADAVAMMGPKLAPNANAKAAWSRQFARITSIRVLNIRPAGLGDEGLCHNYRVTLEAQLSAQASKTPIPNYGWDHNRNYRWITLCPNGRQSWWISSFGTGP